MINDHASILQRELDEIQRQIAALEKATDIEPDYGLGEGDPAITRREMDTALLVQLREKQEALNRAMTETGDGGYGTCENCGNPIHPDRLAVLPDTTLCITCARNA